MKKQDYKSVLGRNNYLQNALALNCLLDLGRNNLLNDDFYNRQLKELEDKYDEDKDNPLMTKDFAMESLKISRQMATLQMKEICSFIQNEIVNSEEQNKENDSPDYDI